MRNKQIFVLAEPSTQADTRTSESRHHQTPPEPRRPGILSRKRSSAKIRACASPGPLVLPTSPKCHTQMVPLAAKRRAPGTVNARAKRTKSPSPPKTYSDEVARDDSQTSNPSAVTYTIATCNDMEALPNAGQTVYMTTQSSVDEMSRTGETTTTAVLIPVMLVESGDNKFGESQKTVVLHVEQMGDGGEGIVELRDLDNSSTHQVGTVVDGDSQEDGIERHTVMSGAAGEIFIDNGQSNKSSGIADAAPVKQTPAGATVSRWYEDQSFVDELQCLLCGLSMEALQLAEHLPIVHGYKLPEVGRAAFLKYIRKEKVPIALMPGRARLSGREGVGACPHCPRALLKRLDLLSHMHEEHGQEFVLFDSEFETSDQFEKWLELITVKFMTGYSKYRTNVNTAGVKTQMYLCRMESKPVWKATTYKTDRRARNRAKTTYCTAHLQVRFLEGGRLHVKGSPTHINHPVNLFSAYRSLDDVPFDALPGYVAVTSKATNDMRARTLEFCQKILRRSQSLSELLHASPAPCDYNITRHLHTKLHSLRELLLGYTFRAITIHEEVIHEEEPAAVP